MYATSIFAYIKSGDFLSLKLPEKREAANVLSGKSIDTRTVELSANRTRPSDARTAALCVSSLYDKLYTTQTVRSRVSDCALHDLVYTTHDKC